MALSHRQQLALLNLKHLPREFRAAASVPKRGSKVVGILGRDNAIGRNQSLLFCVPAFRG